jgi:hypothetical protein
MATAHLSVKVGKAGKGTPHAEYIAREGKYAQRLEQGEQLEATESGNMPKWAQDNPLVFWQAADLYERKNGYVYREHEIALPRELNAEQRAELVREWVGQELGDRHAYTWAIHNKTALDGGEQPHVHLMYSERTNDGIERDPEQYFKRYNAKYPERGGARKATTKGTTTERKEALKAMRDRWEQLYNAHIDRHISSGWRNRRAKISMKSLAEQGITDRQADPHMTPSESAAKHREAELRRIAEPDVRAVAIERVERDREDSKREQERLVAQYEAEKRAALVQAQAEREAEQERIKAAEIARQEAEREKARAKAEQEKLKAEADRAYSIYSEKKAKLGSRGWREADELETHMHKMVAQLPADMRTEARIHYWNDAAKDMHGLEFRNDFIPPKYSTAELMERYEAVSDWIAPSNRHVVEREMAQEDWYFNQRHKINDIERMIDGLRKQNDRLFALNQAEQVRRENKFFGIAAMLWEQNDTQRRNEAQYHANQAKIDELKAERDTITETYKNRFWQEVNIEYRHFNKELKALRQEIAKRPLEEFAAIWIKAKSQMQTEAGLREADRVFNKADREQDGADRRITLYFGAQQMKETDRIAQEQQERQNRRSRGRGFGGRKIDRGDDFGISD